MSVAMRRYYRECNSVSCLCGLALGVAVALAASAAASEVASSLPDQVPRFVADAAEASVSDFAYALAEARLPGGVVAFERDFERGSGTLWQRRSTEEAAGVPLREVVTSFRRRHARYDIEEREGVMLVRARQIELRVGPLAKTADRFRVDGLDPLAALHEAMRMVDASIPGGVVGSFLGGLPEARAPITLDMPNVTFLEVLNEIVRQAPGTVWILLQHGEPPRRGYYTLGFRAPDGRSMQFKEPLGG